MSLNPFLFSDFNVCMAVIIGIDPGTQFLGFGIVELKGSEIVHVQHGVITLGPEGNLAQRLGHLSEELQVLLQTHRPSLASVEQIFMARNADSAFKLGHARGVCLAELAKQKVQVFEHAARTVKKSITGYGAAEKEQVRMVLSRLLKISIVGKTDASDALALAYHQARVSETEMLLKKQIKPTALKGESFT